MIAKNCLSCHGSAKMGGLQLDSYAHLVKGGQGGPAIVAGDPDGSVLIQAIRGTHPRIKMPPQGKLSDREIDDLASWVRSGAAWPEAAPVARGEQPKSYWAFQPVQKPSIPKVSDDARPLSDLDKFIFAKLKAEGLKPAPPADKRTLIRRATLDLLGLPPAPEEVDAFIRDRSSNAFAKVIDRLLASPHYGERWGRYWLDLARYSDGQLGASKDTPFPNAYRYRDWVIGAFNEDMPYDVFAKAQIAGDLMKDSSVKLLPGLGFYSLGPGEDDRVDVTGQVFLGLTIGCARCHDHKYDPIPTKDFYSLLGVFKSSEAYEYPLVDESVVQEHKRIKKDIEDQKNLLDDFVQKQITELSEILAPKTSRYMMAAWDVISGGANLPVIAGERKLDETTLKRWVTYLKATSRDHKFLEPWDELVARKASRADVQQFADKFSTFVVRIFADKHGMDDRNYVKLGGAAGARDEKTRQYTNLESLPIEQYYLWRDLASDPYKKDFLDFKGGVYYYGPKEIDRFLSEEWREHHQRLTARLEELKKQLPEQYPFLHTLRDKEKPADIKVYVRGDEKNEGEIAPRQFLRVLSQGDPIAFRQGSGRMELANKIADASNPLFARVMVNRIWQHHFGGGIVRTPSNFGQLGERPTHPELLDYLASRFVQSGWSVKAMHREMMLSSTYQMSAETSEANLAKDPGNKYLWRASLQQRLDAEALRDSLLAVSGELDRTVGGPPVPLNESNRRRTVYASIERTKPDAELALFDFPNPNATSEQRLVTVGPMQRLYFMNNSFVAKQAKALAQRLSAETLSSKTIEADKVRRVYKLLFAREPNDAERQLATEFLESGANSWPQYVQVLLSSAEFQSVN